MVLRFLILPILLSYIGTGALFADAAKAKRCFQCRGVMLPADCDKVTDCTAGQICMVERFITESGHALYNSGCRSEPSCHLKRRHIVSYDVTALTKRDDLMVCQECCDGDYCNNQGCGSQVNQQPHRGPYCFKCDAMTSPDQCRTVSTCNRGEVCMLIENVMSNVHGQHTYKTACSSQRTCQAGDQVSIFGKKRAVRCHTCCQGDFCNNKCNFEQYTTPPTTHATTKPSFIDLCHAHHYTYDSHSHFCYAYHTTLRTWTDANNYCKSTGGMLAVIDTSAKWSLFQYRIMSHYGVDVWIGGHDTGHPDNNFHWTNGQPMTQHGWGPGQPDGGGQDCVYVENRDHRWHDINCSNHKSFLCTISEPHN